MGYLVMIWLFKQKGKKVLWKFAVHIYHFNKQFSTHIQKYNLYAVEEINGKYSVEIQRFFFLNWYILCLKVKKKKVRV